MTKLPTSTLRRLVIALMLAAVVWCGIRNFYVPPEYSRAFRNVPDGVENTLAMKNFMDGHGFTIRLNGVDRPARYQPWFSFMFVAPALLFAGGNVLCAWYGCFAAGVVALLAAFFIGRKLGGGACGVLLAAVLAVFADFARYASVPMTEVPCTMLLMLAALAFLKLCESRETRVADCLLFGVCCAFAGALRSTSLVLAALVIVPLWRRRSERKTCWAALAAAALPVLAVAAANAICNRAVFGEFFRSGYHYWEPRNYDCLDMTFNWRYVGRNLRGHASMLNLWFLLLPAAATAFCWFFLRRRDREKARLLGYFAVFVAAVAAVTAAVYLPYYFPYQDRFFVPVRTLALLCGTAAAALLAESFFRRRGDAALGVTALAVALFPWPDPHREELEHDALRSAKIELLMKMGDTLPDNAVLLTLFPQGPAEYFFVGRTERRIVPLYRCYEYAEMVTAKRKIPAPPGGFGKMTERDASDYLASHGGVRPYPFVYSEAPEELDKLVRSGVPVYVSDYSLLIHGPVPELEGALRRLFEKYRLVPVGNTANFTFYRLTPRRP